MARKLSSGNLIFIDFDCTICDHSTLEQMGLYGKDADITKIKKSHFLKYSVPFPNAVEVITKLHKKFDLYILTGDSGWWKGGLIPEESRGMNWKPEWLVKYFGPTSTNIFTKKVIYCSHKELLASSGGYLIDDALGVNGTSDWYKKGKLIHFGSEQYPDWISVGKFFKVI